LLARSGFLLLRAQKNRWIYLTLDRIFSAAGRRVKLSPENRAVLRLAGVGRHFSARAGSFRSSAEDLKLQLLFQIFSDFFE